ncbi:PREDICTED: tRNA modification GTPase GTPBP3, mitochondrial-like [Priapulus caudatus]|uniref:tRNA modification GTPase GTPBP3, mitochondrial-like n=1 Tax=Priapulus caudatus TaxID=37621 RepID=A0ABM1E7M5_PRICU|nr:PREDICTED: tRNA modification GTPase GTPBP3, mitochondrial-like [Priapulus caudatus]
MIREVCSSIRQMHSYRPVNSITKRLVNSSSTSVGDATIFAHSSGYGKCGVAVIKVSGPASSQVLRQITKQVELPKARMAVLKRLYSPGTTLLLDKAVVLWCPGPKTSTGEDCCELHVHGGPSVIRAVMDALVVIPGVRHAEAGEFTKRAFINGKLDLTEVEGLADLIHAETETQRRQALRQMDGALTALYSDWRERLIKALAHVEAYIDFSEDDNIEEKVMKQVEATVRELLNDIRRHMRDSRQGERLRTGVHVAIVGRPNVGKSSLLNYICRQPKAIVSPIPGTTRDVIESAYNIGGYPVVLCDTAGIRPSSDTVEQEGVARAKRRAESADLVLMVVDITELEFVDDPYQYMSSLFIELGLRTSADFSHISCNNRDRGEPDVKAMFMEDGEGDNVGFHTPTEDSFKRQPVQIIDTNHQGECSHDDKSRAEWQARPESCDVESGGATTVNRSANTAQVDSHLMEAECMKNEKIPVILVLNKSDLIVNRGTYQRWRGFMSGVCQTSIVSCLTDDGMEEFMKIMQTEVMQQCGDPLSGTPSFTQARHRHHLSNCIDALERFLNNQQDIVITAQELRNAVQQLGQVSGEIRTSNILEVIFKDFCIGK